jgi:hypothetical protein
MSRIISYKGQLPIGEQDRIKLKTIKGKVGYKISKFQIIISDTTDTSYQLVAQVFKTDQTGSISANIDFSNGNLLAVAHADAENNFNNGSVIIFDNEKFNQDIFITMLDTDGGTTPGNYYLELEAMELSDLESTYLTLQSMRTISE